jgi:hypothetical protein
MANILLVATGGTRAPTQIELAEHFLADGHAVRLVATTNALRFLGSHMARRPRKIAAFLKHYRPVLRETLAYFVEQPKEVPHIAEGKWADIAIMAPATCNSVGKIAAGVSDNYPLLVLRAVPRTKRVIVVPSMNPEMWYDPVFQRNIDLLNTTEKYRVLCPTRGQMLSGDWGIGAQVPIAEIIAETYRALGILHDIRDPRAAGERAGTAPWTEEAAMSGEIPRVVLVEPDDATRDALGVAIRTEYPLVEVHGFSNVSGALEWLRDHHPVAVFTELDFPHGASGFDLVQHLRRPGQEDVQVVATSRRDRQEIGAERLGRMDVLFAPKPLNVPFVVGMLAGSLRTEARRRSAVTRRTLLPGEVLFRQGDVGSQAFLVQVGRLRIVRHEGDHDIELGIVEPGQMVGELAIVEHSLRAATVTAIDATEVGVLDLEGMRSYLETQPIWLRLVLESLVGHVRETGERLVAAKTG